MSDTQSAPAHTARSWAVLLRPVVSDCLPVFSEEHMYWKISKFLLSHEYLNMDKVPGFYQFFYSSDFEVMLPMFSMSPETPKLDHLATAVILMYSLLVQFATQPTQCTSV
jgi:hypothetical protein